jgi:hypothetical protein
MQKRYGSDPFGPDFGAALGAPSKRRTCFPADSTRTVQAELPASRLRLPHAAPSAVTTTSTASAIASRTVRRVNLAWLRTRRRAPAELTFIPVAGVRSACTHGVGRFTLRSCVVLR